MKKLIPLIFLLLVGSVYAGQLKVISPFISSSIPDGTIGKSDDDAASITQIFTANVYYDKFTASGGNVRYCYARVTNDGSALNLCFSIFDSSETEIISKQVAISHNGAATVEFDMGSSTNLSVAEYDLGIQTDTSFAAGNGVHRSLTGNGYFYNGQAYSCGNDIGGETGAGTEDLALYCKNTQGDPF